MARGTLIFWCTLILINLLPSGNRLAQAMEVPALTARVNDHADILSTATEQQLESVLATLEREESTQLAVLTIRSLEGENLEEFSLKVAEKWGLGQRGRDNGALLLIARDDRKLRIEVGYGLEGVLTDLISGRIIRDVITPKFRQGNFDQGVIDGVGAMIGAVRGEFIGQGSPGTDQRDSDTFGGILTFLAFVFFGFGRLFGRNRVASSFLGAIIAPVIGLLVFGFSWLILLLIPAGLVAGFLASLIFGNMHFSGAHRSGRGGFSSGGFGGGGGFSGGGGGFGGGGSSGGW